MTYDPKYITVKIVVDRKVKEITLAKYWNERLECWKRVFHTWEIEDRDWLKLDHNVQIDLLRKLSQNTAKIGLNNYHEFC